MNDQVIDATMARGLTADACRDHPLLAWVVLHDPPEYPDKFVARLVTSTPSLYLLVADSLAEIQTQLPAGLVRYERQSFHPPDVVEIWFAEERAA
jgi:hypothetical protein